MASLEERIRRIEDRIAIRELVARYGRVIDDRDIAGIAECFAAHGSFRSRDGVMDARGREAVVEQFHGRFAVLGPSFHYTHDHVIELHPHDPDRASGWVNSHAEVVRLGRAMLAAIRYEDEYVREGGRWRFADRLLSFFYYLPPEEYAQVLLDARRNRAYAEPTPADIPEPLESWRKYYGEGGLRPPRRKA